MWISTCRRGGGGERGQHLSKSATPKHNTSTMAAQTELRASGADCDCTSGLGTQEGFGQHEELELEFAGIAAIKSHIHNVTACRSIRYFSSDLLNKHIPSE